MSAGEISPSVLELSKHYMGFEYTRPGRKGDSTIRTGAEWRQIIAKERLVLKDSPTEPGWVDGFPDGRSFFGKPAVLSICLEPDDDD
jgi:hypothetical protein